MSLIRFKYCDKKSGKRYKLDSQSFQKVVKAVDLHLPIRRTIPIEENISKILGNSPDATTRSFPADPKILFSRSSGRHSTTPSQTIQDRIPNYSKTHVEIIPQHTEPRYALATSGPYHPRIGWWDVNERQRIAAQHRAFLQAQADARTSSSSRTSCLATFCFITFIVLFLAIFLAMAYWIRKAKS